MIPGLIDNQPLTGYAPDAVYAAAADVRGYCGWHIAPSIEETITVDGSGSRELILPSLHVTAITAVVENGITLDPTSYQLVGHTRLRRRGHWAYENVTVTFTHGHPTCPLDVRAVIARQAKAGLVPDRSRTSAKLGEVTVNYAAGASDSGGFDENMARVLDRYRLPGRP